jgi:hypothetical protein
MNRFSSCRRVLAIVATAGILSLVSTATADSPVPHKEKGAGHIDSLSFPSATIAVQEWSGGGMATHLGNYTQSGIHAIDLTTGAISGTFTTTASDGSTLQGHYDGYVVMNPDGSVGYFVTAFWDVGTGRLAGVTGVGDVVAIAESPLPGAAYSYVTDGELQFP